MADKTNPEAPHGYDTNGKPLAPYGYKADGSPKLDNRGRAAGTRVAAAPKRKPAPKAAPKKPRTKAEQTASLVGLADIVTMPLVGASKSAWLARHIGEQQTMALAGDAVILDAFTPAAVDLYMQFAETRPSMLTFLETVEENAPILTAIGLGISITKALVSNHMRPDERLARSGLLMAQMKAAQMAEAIEEQAAAMGIDVDQPAPAEPAAA